MVAYCSIMTLLLAFFIILQAFAPTQDEGLYKAGQGSFIRALKTFGLGGLWEPEGGGMLPGQVGPRYRAPEGPEEPPDTRRIDPELEEAQHALQELEDQFDLRELREATGYRVELSSPCSYGPGKMTLTAREEEFLAELAPRLEPVVLARAFVIRIGAALPFLDRDEAERTRSALAAANQVRSKLIEEMSPASREVAARRIYSFFRWESAETGRAEAQAGQLTIDILLTKPYLHGLGHRGAGEDAHGAAG